MAIARTDFFFYPAGLVFLGLAKAQHALRGYTTPKGFSLDEVDQCIEYDIHIGNLYLSRLAKYGVSIEGKRLLELGPGSDIGTGIYLVGKGAESYVGFDRHSFEAPRAFYEQLAGRLGIDLDSVSAQYVVRKDFDIEAIEPGFDIVLSNAAFEHFDDVEKVVRQLSRVTKPGGVIIAEIDLQTHSRWIRDADPNNIYRYPDWLYRLFRFTGSPNRVRPREYVSHFQRYGWTDIDTSPANTLASPPRHVHRRFEDGRLDWLSFVLFARRK